MSFCKIIAGEIPSTKVYEDESVFCFKDIADCSVHYLIVPKEHISGADMINGENSHYIAKIFEAAAKIARMRALRVSESSTTAAMMQDRL